MDTVYLLEGTTGTFEATSWLVAAYSDEQEALDHRSQLYALTGGEPELGLFLTPEECEQLEEELQGSGLDSAAAVLSNGVTYAVRAVAVRTQAPRPSELGARSRPSALSQ